MPTRTVSALGGNWNALATWVEGAVPVAGDDVVCLPAGGSGQLTVNVASACGTLNFTNYTNTLTMSNTLTVGGAVTLAAAMTTAGASALIVTTTATLTSNGKTWTSAMTFQGASQTYTLADAWTVNGTLTIGNGGTTTINGFTISAATSLTVSSTGAVEGTTVINLTGTGTWSNTSSCVLRNSLTINSAGTITITNVSYGVGTLTYTAGTVNATGTLTISQSCTLNTNGINWNNVTLNAVQTNVLSSDFNISGTLLVNGTAGAVVFNGAFNINLSGSLSITTNGTIGGTSTLVASGTGTWTTSGAAAAIIMNMNINTAGTLTFGSIFRFGTGTLTYIAGTVTSTSGRLGINTNCTLDLKEISIYQLEFSFGGRTVTLASGFTIKNSFISTAPTAALPCSFVSSSPGTKRSVVLAIGATQDVGYVSATDVDSSAGQTIWTFKGTITTTFNWNSLTAQLKVSGVL